MVACLKVIFLLLVSVGEVVPDSVDMVEVAEL